MPNLPLVRTISLLLLVSACAGPSQKTNESTSPATKVGTPSHKAESPQQAKRQLDLAVGETIKLPSAEITKFSIADDLIDVVPPSEINGDFAVIGKKPGTTRLLFIYGSGKQEILAC